MALEEYAGAIVLEIDGQEVEVLDLNVSTKTGRKLVKTMNRTGRAKGFARGIAEIDLTLTVAIPESGEPAWSKIEGAKVTVHPLEGVGQRTSYYDCFTTEVGAKYSVDNEARRDIRMAALREVIE